MRYAARTLLRQPGLTLAAVITLALGIGANTTIFSVVNAILLRPLPFKDPDQLVYLWETDRKTGSHRDVVSPANFLDWQEQNHSFQQMSAWRTWFYTLGGTSEPEQVWGVRTSANFFELLGVRAAKGRAFLPSEGQSGNDQVVVLSDHLWRRRFGADTSVLEKPIMIDGQPFTVIGILPPDFNLFGGQRHYDLWMPFVVDRDQLKRDDHSILVFARLKPDVPLTQAQTEMTGIGARLAQAYPATNRDRGVQIVALKEDQTSNLRPGLLILFAVVACVLLIACTNVANLLLARAGSRHRELAVRVALGASRGRLMRQLLSESVLLATIGCTAGLALAGLSLKVLRIINQAGAVGLPYADSIAIDGRVLAFTLVTSAFTILVFGLGPAWQASKPDLGEALNEAGKGSSQGRRSLRWQRTLVVSEVALVLVLLIAATLLLRSFVTLLADKPGYDSEHLLTMQIWLPESRYAKSDQVVTFYQQTLQGIKSLPGVESASAINFLPFTGWGDATGFEIAGRPVGEYMTAQYRVIDPAYFRTMRIPLWRGREFVESDRDQAQGVAIINQTMARRYWPDEDPLGKQIRAIFAPTKTPWRPTSSYSWLTIVGIAADIKEVGFIDQSTAEFYLPYAQSPSALMRLVIRSTADPLGLEPAVRREVLTVDKNQAISEIKSMKQLISESRVHRRFNLLLLGVFASVALILAATGIYGVISYSVSQRVREIGVRVALGASAGDVLKLVVGQGIKLTAIGIAIGLASALALTRVMTNQLYGVGAADPTAFVSSCLLLTMVALLVCYLPARRAARMDPLVALRHE